MQHPAMAGAVKGDLSSSGNLISRQRPLRNAKLVEEELGQLECGRCFDSHHRVSMPKHGGARGAGGYDRMVAFKNFQTASGNRLGSFPVSRIEGRLAAASLVFWKIDLAASMLENPRRRDAHLAIEGVAGS